MSSQVRTDRGKLFGKTAVVSKLLGLTARSVQKQVKAGVLPAPGPQGWHDLAAAVQAYVAYSAAGRIDDPGLAGARERLARAQAVKVETDNAERRGQIVLVSYVAEVLHSLAADLAARLDSLPGRVASELAGMTSAAEIRALLLRETRSIRSGVADHIGRMANTPPKGARRDNRTS